MRPGVTAVFFLTAQQLLERVVPAITAEYHQGTIGMVASMLAQAAEEWDRAASRRVEENRSLRNLFRAAAPVVEQAALRERLTRLAAGSDEDLRISSLENDNCTLRAALIDLHRHIETLKGPQARQIEDAIWKELAASTERRRFSTAPF